MTKIWPATLVFLTLSAACSGSQPPPAPCGEPGQWLDPASPSSPLVTDGADGLLTRMARQQVVLLGETHDSAEDHRWQLHTLARLHALRPDLAVGFEMFPRRLQPVLDRWVAGGLSEQAFLEQVEWDKIWTFDARDYLPLFHFARMNRLPMLALNVERSLPDAVGKQGWAGVAEDRKEGVSRPAPPAPAYLEELRTVYEHHPERERSESAFERFVEAQTVWDRAMGQAMAEHLARRPDTLVVAIVGAGHVRHGYGVAHQLKDLGIPRVGALITWDRTDGCGRLAAGLADGVYVVDPPAQPQPRLGVAMGADAQGVRITAVDGGSVADQAGLKGGDLVVEIAGRPARTLDALRAAVQRQPAGTWLPLKVKRGGELLEIVARFPPNP